MGGALPRRRRPHPLRRAPPAATIAARATRRPQRALARGRSSASRAGRRTDLRKGVAPSLARELRTFAGCCWHVPRRLLPRAASIMAAAQRRPHRAGARAADERRSAARRARSPSGESGIVAGVRAERAHARRGRAARRAPRRDAGAAAAGARRRRRAAAPPRARARDRADRPRQPAAAGARRADAARATTMRLATTRRPRPRQVGEPQPAARAATRRRARLAAAARRRRRAAARLPRPASCSSPSASACGSRSRPTAAARTPPGASRDGAAAASCARPASSRSARSARSTASTFETLLPFPQLKAGWGLDAHWARSRASTAGRSASSTRRRSATCCARSPTATGATTAVAEARAYLAGRPHVTPRRGAAHDRDAPAGVARTPDAKVGRSSPSYYPRAERPGARRLGAPPGARRARRRRRRARARAAPPAAAAGRASSGSTSARCGPRCSQPRARRARRDRGHLRAVPVAAAAVELRRLGRVGGAGAEAALRELHERFPFELVHAHYAVPAGDAVRRALPGAPLVVSVHGGDVLATIERSPTPAAPSRAPSRTRAGARQQRRHGRPLPRRRRRRRRGRGRPSRHGPAAGRARPPPDARRRRRAPTLVTVGHLVARKRHADVLEALARLAPTTRRCAGRSSATGRAGRAGAARARAGVADRVDFRGQLPPTQARARAQAAGLFVLPSVDEAFGVAYVEAMAGGVPAIGCAGEDGPEEIAALGGGLLRVPPARPGRARGAARPAAARRRPSGPRSAPPRARPSRQQLHVAGLRRRDRRRLPPRARALRRRAARRRRRRCADIGSRASRCLHAPPEGIRRSRCSPGPARLGPGGRLCRAGPGRRRPPRSQASVASAAPLRRMGEEHRPGRCSSPRQRAILRRHFPVRPPLVG